jgi:hypothetical protein
MTQRELGTLASLSQTEIHLVETGKRRLSGAARMRIIRAFDLSRDQASDVTELTHRMRA